MLGKFPNCSLRYIPKEESPDFVHPLALTDVLIELEENGVKELFNVQIPRSRGRLTSNGPGTLRVSLERFRTNLMRGSRTCDNIKTSILRTIESTQRLCVALHLVVDVNPEMSCVTVNGWCDTPELVTSDTGAVVPSTREIRAHIESVIIGSAG